jgi:hypothetical protein
MAKFKLHDKIKELENSGWEVDVEHNRTYIISPSHQNEIYPRGGSTVAILTHRGTGQVIVGSAKCSEGDNYNRRIGATIALGRALKQKQIDERERERVRLSFTSR